MSIAVENKKKVWTEAEIEALPEDGCLHEVVDGKRVMSPKNNFCHSSTPRRLLGSGGSLDGGDLLPGFQYPVADLFKEWEW